MGEGEGEEEAEGEKIARFVNISNESGKRSWTDESDFICRE